MFTSICIGFIFVGLSNYRYYSAMHPNDNPIIALKRKTALRLILIASTFAGLSLLIIALLLMT